MKAFTTILYVILAIIAGAMLPLQSSVNITLLEPLVSPFAPSCVSSIAGAIFLLILWPYDPRRAVKTKGKNLVQPKDLVDGPSESKMTTWARLKMTEKYLFILPGALGIYYAIIAVLIAKKIGLSLFYIAIVAGQMIGATCIDHFGWFGLPMKKTTFYRMMAMVIAFAGAIMAVIEKLKLPMNAESSGVSSEEHDPVWKTVIFIILAFLGGVSLAIQVSMNVLMSKQLVSLPHRISWWTMVIAALLVVIICAIAAGISDEYRVDFKALKGTHAWQYTGGLLSAMYLVFSVLLGPKLGLSLFVVLVVAGQLLASLLLDSFGWIGSFVIPATPLRVCGIIIVFIAVVAFRFEDRFKKAFLKKFYPKSNAHETTIQDETDDDVDSSIPDSGLQQLIELEAGKQIFPGTAPEAAKKNSSTGSIQVQ